MNLLVRWHGKTPEALGLPRPFCYFLGQCQKVKTEAKERRKKKVKIKR
jgi:hypothetical protein